MGQQSQHESAITRFAQPDVALGARYPLRAAAVELQNMTVSCATPGISRCNGAGTLQHHTGVHPSHVLVVALVAAGLHLSSLYSYLLFHSLVELCRVVVLFGIFVLAWNSRRWSTNNFVLVAGVAFVFVGFLELLHTLAYKGMGVFGSSDANLATQLWIGGRYLEVLSLIAAVGAVGRRLNLTATILAFAALTTAAAGAIFAGAFPDCFVEGEGQTAFKIASDYVIAGLFLAVIVPLVRRRLFDRAIRSLLIASLATSAVAQLAFTRYVSVYGAANEIGHLLLLLSTYFLYRAVLVTGIVNPVSLLFQSLKESEERYEHLANAAKEGVLIYDDLRIVVTNATFLRMFGVPDGETIAQPLGEFFAPECRRETLARLRGNDMDGYEAVGLRRDGSTFPVQLSGNAISYDGRDMRVALVRDLTADKRAEEERRALQSELEHASRLSEIGQMAAALAHELNQPLTAVVTYLGACRRILEQAVEEEARKRKLHEVMGLAGAQARRAGEIIRRVREFIGTGQTERTVEDAAAVIREASTLAIAAARHNGVRIRSDFAEPGRVVVNKVQIQQVIVNLVRNAIEAMDGCPRKELDIVLSAAHEFVEVTVSDTGPGMPPDMAGRLFKPFASTKKKGMGIGLSVCREIVEAHHGKIWVEPKPGGGTVFQFTLPLMRDELIA